MSKEPASPNDISEAALKVFSREELAQMPKPQCLTLMGLIEKRLNKDKPEPTLAELQGIRELVTDHLWSPAFNGLSQLSQVSRTTDSQTSD